MLPSSSWMLLPSSSWMLASSFLSLSSFSWWPSSSFWWLSSSSSWWSSSSFSLSSSSFLASFWSPSSLPSSLALACLHFFFLPGQIRSSWIAVQMRLEQWHQLWFQQLMLGVMQHWMQRQLWFYKSIECNLQLPDGLIPFQQFVEKRLLQKS